MAKISASYSTRNAKANREDLSNLISNIDPTDTPFMTLIGSGARNVKNINFDWQVDHLKAVDNDNAEVEGFEVRRQKARPTVRNGNTAQISTKNATVSGSQQASDPAGKTNEMAYQMANRSKELKRDMETILLSAQARDPGFNDGDDEDTLHPRRLRGFEHFLTTNAFYGDGGKNASDETGDVTDGAQRDFTEEELGDGLQQAWTNGANPTQLLVGAGVKRVVSTFQGRANTYQQTSPTSASNTVSIYASDFGDIRVKLSRWQRPRTAFAIDPSKVRLAYFRRFQSKPLAPIGDAETRMILVEYSLQVDNEAAHIKFADLITSVAKS